MAKVFFHKWRPPDDERHGLDVAAVFEPNALKRLDAPLVSNFLGSSKEPSFVGSNCS
jgi:hypothetical protein